MAERKDDDISALLGGLSIKESKKLDAKSSRLQRELDRVGFRIFECISDNGFFAWNPPRGAAYKILGNITDAKDLQKYMDLEGKPDVLVRPSSIRLPVSFLSPPPDERENKHPFGKIDATCIHVAACHRGIDFTEIDFAFGGSTLEMLASCDASDPYMVTLVPGTPTILVVKNKDYIQNLSDVGFQFERLMTGKPMRGDNSDVLGSVEHLHVMNVGTYRVLFRAEVDAVDDSDGDPVEIKASNPRYWGTKVMFQMISSGSTRLCHGVKGRGNLRGIHIQSLQEVSRTAMTGRSVLSLEETILQGMASLRFQMKDTSPGEVFRVSFSTRKLKLSPVRGRSGDILPPADVVRELMASQE